LGYSDFSEYFIGHNGSTYWRKKESEKAELFKKIEPYLTFLNIHQLERQGADIQSKVEELEGLRAYPNIILLYDIRQHASCTNSK
jgi:hypothetical protein